MIIPAQSLIMILSVILGFALFTAIVLLFYRLISRERRLAKAEKKTLSHYQEIIDKANREASEILAKATEVSENVITQSKATNENIASDLDKIFHEMAEKHIKAMGEEVTTFKKEYEDKIMQMQQAVDQNTEFVIQNTQNNLNKNLEQFSKTMFDRTTSSAGMLEQKTKELLAQAETNIQEYKEAEMAKIDKAIMALIQKTYQNLLEKDVPPEINRNMILKALEKSKEEGLFNL